MYREEALRRFRANPEKCYQRYIREVEAENDPRPQLENLRGTHVKPVDVSVASSFIRRYEWLGTMAQATTVCFGLWPTPEFFQPEHELLGVVCFSKSCGNRAALASLAPFETSLILARGACTMRAGKNAASFLISRSCKILAGNGYTHVLAYSDPDAGEKGHIYRTLGWQCLGPSKQGEKAHFVGPDGQYVSSYTFTGDRTEWIHKLGRAYGKTWDPEALGAYAFLRSLCFKEVKEAKKVRWLWVAPKKGR